MNNWSCLPMAFARCLGLPLERLTETIGHDGSVVTWPNSPEPLSRRGFHIQEILYAIHQYGYSAMPVGINPTLTNGVGPRIEIEDKFFKIACLKLGVHLGITDSGINHAVAHLPITGFWCPNRGHISEFNTREIWLVNKCTE